MRRYYFTLSVLICFLFGWSCLSVPTEIFDSSVNGKNIMIQRNEQFIVNLDVHADGGYQWDCQISDSTILKKDSTHIAPKNSNRNIVGGLSVETFYLSSSSKPGQCTINLIEHRGWEQNIPPINTVQFHVVVK